MIANYQLNGNPVVEVPIVGNLAYDELGREVLARHNEGFRGVPHIEDNTKYKEGQPLSYSNVPRVLSYNQILREISPNVQILSPEEVVQFWDSIPERDSTYADTNSIAVYPTEGPNEDLRKIVLNLLNLNPTIPLKVSGLGVDKADNNLGFTFTRGELTQVAEAHYLEKDGRVSYENGELVASEQGIPVWTAQSGLRRFYRNRSDWLFAGNDNLLNSNDSGRVQVLQDPQGRTENLESKLLELNAQKEQQIAEIEARYRQASGFLRTGRFQ
ncbi:hypothetical protein J4442_05365 [Candidatus Woesearchaeota archaeon]|nr:hypothetical protein [Candidatus Woesearchaeota archaeon]